MNIPWDHFLTMKSNEQKMTKIYTQNIQCSGKKFYPPKNQDFGMLTLGHPQEHPTFLWPDANDDFIVRTPTHMFMVLASD